ncbi:MAG: endonuclease III [Deltaproteobacteria bacterium]|nr:endonuclease III [Deltaproteobacteria bacterium]
MLEKQRIQRILKILNHLYLKPVTALQYTHPHELLFSTILSAQCTDKQVNKVTPALFAKYKTVQDFAEADLKDLEKLIRSIGFFRSKALAIQSSARTLMEKFKGKVPQTLEELTQLRGVGRKTANVVLGDVFKVAGVVVDTHVKRLAYRLGLTENTDPVKIEQDLMKLIPKKNWTAFSHQLILHGRAVCKARRPWCGECELKALCPKKGV